MRSREPAPSSWVLGVPRSGYDHNGSSEPRSSTPSAARRRRRPISRGRRPRPPPGANRGPDHELRNVEAGAAPRSFPSSSAFPNVASPQSRHRCRDPESRISTCTQACTWMFEDAQYPRHMSVFKHCQASSDAVDAGVNPLPGGPGRLSACGRKSVRDLTCPYNTSTHLCPSPGPTSPRCP